MIDKLTVKQEKFCNNYVETGNASEAYRRSYSCENMKSETINEKASRLLKECKISARIEELRRNLQERSDFTKDEAVEFLSNVIRANILDYVGIDDSIAIKESKNKPLNAIVGVGSQIVTVKDLSKLTIEQQRCIKSISQTKFGVRLELCEKDPALTRLAKMLGWDESTKLSIEENINQVTVFELPNNGRSKDK